MLNMQKATIFLVATTILACTEAAGSSLKQIPSYYVGKETANITDYEIKGINALFELANLTTHIPESFIVNKRAAKAVLQQITVFEKVGTDNLMAGGFVAAFLDLIDSTEEVVQLLKAIDLRLSML